MLVKFAATWDRFFKCHLIEVNDPAKLEGWGSPVIMMRKVLSIGLHGGPNEVESRRSDEVTVMGEGGLWEGVMTGHPFRMFNMAYGAPPPDLALGVQESTWTHVSPLGGFLRTTPQPVDPQGAFYVNVNDGVNALNAYNYVGGVGMPPVENED